MNVLYAAAVSVVVTLTIEWLAKPWLESNKEQKLERDRALRSILNLTRDYVWRIEQRLIRSAEPLDFHDHRAEFVRTRSTIGLPRDKEKREALANLTQIMEDPGSKTAQQQHAILLAALEVLEAPWYQFKRRRQATAAFHQRVAETAKPGFSSNYQVGPGNQASRR